MEKLKRTRKKIDMEVLILGLVIVILFGAFFSVCGFALYRRGYLRNYMRQAGNNFTGKVTIFVETEEYIAELSHDNGNKLAKDSVIGTINLKRMKDVPLGDRLKITSVSENGVKRVAYIDKLKDDKSMVTIENENGEIVVVLDNVRYSTFERLVTDGIKNGENIIVDKIP